jgi:hypothetical protein
MDSNNVSRVLSRIIADHWGEWGPESWSSNRALGRSPWAGVSTRFGTTQIRERHHTQHTGVTSRQSPQSLRMMRSTALGVNRSVGISSKPAAPAHLPHTETGGLQSLVLAHTVEPHALHKSTSRRNASSDGAVISVSPVA